MRCGNCGSEVDAASQRRCPNCGAKVARKRIYVYGKRPRRVKLSAEAKLLLIAVGLCAFLAAMWGLGLSRP